MASCPVPERVIGSGVGVAVGASGVGVVFGSGVTLDVGIVGVISGVVLIGVGVGVGASGVGDGEGINIPIMNKTTNVYIIYPNNLIIRLSLRIKGNLSFIPIFATSL